MIFLPLVFLPIVFAAFSPAGPNVVAYFGQGPGQEKLATYCKTKTVDIVVLSFVFNFSLATGISYDFGNACDSRSGLCQDLASQIAECQDRGVKVLLSIGGEIGDYSLAAEFDGRYMARSFYDEFGPNGKVFPNVELDGVDLDIELGRHGGYPYFVSEIKLLFGPDFLVSAAPQCVYPDRSLGAVMSTSQIDMAFIQFYNNYCSLDKQFNWDTWENATFANPNMKLYIGLPGSKECAGSGYVDMETVNRVTQEARKSSKFGGFSIWDLLRGANNGEFIGNSTKFADGAAKMGIFSGLKLVLNSK